MIQQVAQLERSFLKKGRKEKLKKEERDHDFFFLHFFIRPLEKKSKMAVRKKCLLN